MFIPSKVSYCIRVGLRFQWGIALTLTDLGSVISRLEAYSEMERTEDPLFASIRAPNEENPMDSGTRVR